MKHLPKIAIVSALLACATPAAAWGPIGHRVSAELAERNISGKTRAEIERVLGRETLAEASTVPDEEKSNPDEFWRHTANPWHYVTLPDGTDAEHMHHPAEGDALTALEQFTATLRNPEASQEEKALALRFIVHLVPDLHQPLHAGNGTDRGANDFKVLWFDKPTNLHWVWDEGIIQQQQMGAWEYAARLERRLTPAMVIENWDVNPAVWVNESTALRDQIYPAKGGEAGEGTFESPVKLSWNYNWQWRPAMEERLMQGGVRLAAYLDWVFAE